jgi:hypothetical protein
VTHQDGAKAVTMGEGQTAAVQELWRFPVKSMQGERVDASDVTSAGLVGDRGYAVVDADTGRVGSAKHPRLWGGLLQCTARYDTPPVAGGTLPTITIRLPDGGVTGSGDPEVDRRLSDLLGHPVRLTTVAPDGNAYRAVWPDIDGVIPDDYLQQVSVDEPEPEGRLTELSLALASPPGTFFDVAALHVVNAGTLRHLTEARPSSRFAVQRYRPNIVVESSDPPFAENTWSGATVRFGTALQTTVLLPTMRCIMTTLAQGDLPRDNEILRAVSSLNRLEIPGLGTWSCVGAYAAVAEPGTVRVGDEVAIDRTADDAPATDG